METASPSLWSLSGRPRLVSLAFAAAAATLALGLLLPVMRMETLVLWEDEYSILVGTWALLTGGHVALGLILFLFSVVFPIAKLVTLWGIWYRPLGEAVRARRLGLTAALGKWSMLDVFVVAITIVLTTSSALAKAEAQAGLYLFAISVIVTMLLGVRTEAAEAGRRVRAAATPDDGGPDGAAAGRRGGASGDDGAESVSEAR